jgi:hypothetical protein
LKLQKVFLTFCAFVFLALSIKSGWLRKLAMTVEYSGMTYRRERKELHAGRRAVRAGYNTQGHHICNPLGLQRLVEMNDVFFSLEVQPKSSLPTKKTALSEKSAE